MLVTLHDSIAAHSKAAGQSLARTGPRIPVTYPPDEQLTVGEIVALARLESSADLSEALRKVIASSIAAVFFDHFALLDGVADPVGYDDLWVGLELALDEHGHRVFLHEEFLPSFSRWEERDHPHAE